MRPRKGGQRLATRGGGFYNMIVMPASACGWLWHSLARETSCIGHLYSPGDQRGPWPWIPYALDNGAFSCWTQKTNTFDHAKWANKEYAWRTLIMWAQTVPIKPLWAIVPDVPGNGLATLNKWEEFAPEVVSTSQSHLPCKMELRLKWC